MPPLPPRSKKVPQHIQRIISKSKVREMPEEIRANLHKGRGFRELLERHGNGLGYKPSKETVLEFLRICAKVDLRNQLGREPTREEYKTYLLALKHFGWKKDLGELSKQDIEELLEEIQIPF